MCSGKVEFGGLRAFVAKKLDKGPFEKFGTNLGVG